jgi:hypothetical protein
VPPATRACVSTDRGPIFFRNPAAIATESRRTEFPHGPGKTLFLRYNGALLECGLDGIEGLAGLI